MTINLTAPDPAHELKPRIVVVGVGGAGGNAVNNMIAANLEGVEFLACNTDAQALALSKADRRIQLGLSVTQGLGAGSRPDVGRAAAEEGLDAILEYLDGAHMVFITAGMGGGTGTGAAPVIARAARERGILAVGVVTKPFHFEGQHRMRIGEQGIDELQQFVDTLIIIPNQNLFRVANEKTTFADAFKMADDVLYSGVRGVTDLMVMPGLINLDFADIRTVMSEMGKAMMGTGEAQGERRSLDAAEAAISNPLLDDVSMKGAKGVLINITGGMDMTLFEVDEAANRIRDEVDPEANIIFGSTFDEHLEGSVRVSVVATGIDAAAVQQPKPLRPVLVSERPAPRTIAVPGPQAAQALAVASEPLRVVRAVSEAPQAMAAAAEPAPAVAPAAVATAHAAPPVRHAVAPPAPAAIKPAPVQRTSVAAAPNLQPGIFASHEPEPSAMAGQIATPSVPTAEAAPPSAGVEASKVRRGMAGLFNKVTGAARRPPEPQHEPAAPSQPRLGGLDPGDRLATSKGDDDLLEIPAFLRRQAN
jgi:cell division protein FtsZ